MNNNYEENAFFLNFVFESLKNYVFCLRFISVLSKNSINENWKVKSQQTEDVMGWC